MSRKFKIGELFFGKIHPSMGWEVFRFTHRGVDRLGQDKCYKLSDISEIGKCIQPPEE